jgi:hypothetical protein
VPEGQAVTKRIRFIRSTGECAPGYRLIDLTQPALLKERGAAWASAFVAWLSRLNASNASLEWWAYASTSKNLLSSPLGERYLQVLAVCEAARGDVGSMLCVLGATPGQMAAIERVLGPEGFDFGGSGYRLAGISSVARRVDAALRQAYIAMRTWLGHLGAARGLPAGDQDLCLFTYADMPPRPAFDAYFGTLPQQLGKIRASLKIFFAAYLYAPYGARLRELGGERAAPTTAIFGALSFADYAWALGVALGQALGNPSAKADEADRRFAPLLEEALLDDLRFGGYLHHLLIHRSAQRLFERVNVAMLLYPFENKSIEKCLLLGARAGRPRMRITGHQHTSVTSRHIGFSLSESEARATPLPDRIVTVGDVTREWLQGQGYAPAMLVSGCSLRQSLGDPLPARVPDARLRVLLPLSSSARELRDAVRLAREASAAHPDLLFAVRPHPNFPLALLEPDELEWVRRTGRDCTATALRADLEWCDVVAYMSSSVALEALAAGRPVVHLTLADYLKTDPVLGSIAYHRVATTPGELVQALRDFQGLTDAMRASAQAEAMAYVRRYLRPPTVESLSAFLG